MLDKLKIRYSSLTTFMKNRELYKRIYVDNIPYPSSPAQVIGQALHKKLLEEDSFYNEFVVGADTKHPNQEKFCILVAQTLSTLGSCDFDFIDSDEYYNLCHAAGYVKSSARTKWVELLADEGIKTTIKMAYNEIVTGVKLVPISVSEYDKVCEIINKIKDEKFARIKGGGFVETEFSLADMVKKSVVEESFLFDYDEDCVISSRLDQYYISKSGEIYCIDYKFLKTVDDAADKMLEYKYDIQAYLYSLQLFNKFKGEYNLADEFDIKNLYIAVEKEYPYRIKFITFSKDRLKDSKQKVEKAIAELKKCHETGNFIDYDNRFHTI